MVNEKPRAVSISAVDDEKKVDPGKMEEDNNKHEKDVVMTDREESDKKEVLCCAMMCVLCYAMLFLFQS